MALFCFYEHAGKTAYIANDVLPQSFGLSFGYMVTCGQSGAPIDTVAARRGGAKRRHLAGVPFET